MLLVKMLLHILTRCLTCSFTRMARFLSLCLPQCLQDRIIKVRRLSYTVWGITFGQSQQQRWQQPQHKSCWVFYIFH
jgi:hypothetical protein